MKKNDWHDSEEGKSGFAVTARVLLTGVVIFLLIILNLIPFHAGNFDQIRPPFFLMAIYYWGVVRPQLLSAGACFGLGLLIDFVAGLPPGLTALIFVGVGWLTRTQRRFLMGQSFIILWWGFLLVLLLSGAVQWLILSLYNFELLSFGSSFVTAVLGALIFPLVVPLLYFIHRTLSEAERLT